VFPAGKNDDDVDCSSLIGRAIDMAHPAIVRDKPANKPRDRWNKDDREEETSWKVL